MTPHRAFRSRLVLHALLPPLALAASGPLPATAQALPDARALPVARIDSVFLEMNRSHRPGCTLAVFEAGEIAYANGYGMANLEYGIALRPRSVFHIASISKQFTAFAVELLVAEGKVSWDDPVQEYVPEIPEYGRPVTLRHLVHHTSGVRDQWNLLLMAGWRWEADLVTQADALDLISRQTALNFEPGAEYLYSNSGFTLLAVVVERVTGRSLREFARDRIFDPLGMSDTHFHDDHETIVPDRAYGYRRDSEEGWKISIPDFAIVGASSLFTTVEDMARWDRNLRDRTLGDSALWDRLFQRGVLTTGDTIGYAHGISVGSYRGQPSVGHGGADAGYRTNYLRFPELDAGIVSFCNFARADPGDYVREVADIVLEDRLDPPDEEDDDEPEPPEIDLERWADALEGLAGFYRDPRQDRPLQVWIHDGRARIDQAMGEDDDGELLVPRSRTAFTTWPGEGEIAVSWDGDRPRELGAFGRRHTYLGPPASDVDPAPYLGTYESDELGTEYRIEAAEDGEATLALVHRKRDVRRFEAVFEDGFRAGGDWLTFQRGDDGAVAGFTWSNGRVRKVRFVRRAGPGS